MNRFFNRKMRRLEIKCVCGKTRKLFESSQETIIEASQRLLSEGWNVTNSKPLCPKCNAPGLNGTN